MIKRVRDHVYVGDLEKLLLLAILRNGGTANVSDIIRTVSARTGRALQRSNVAHTAERLLNKGFVFELQGTTARRWELSPAGREALADSFGMLQAMADGLVLPMPQRQPPTRKSETVAFS